MGIRDRAYMHDSNAGDRNWWTEMPPVVKFIGLLSVTVYLLQIFVPLQSVRERADHASDPMTIPAHLLPQDSQIPAEILDAMLHSPERSLVSIYRKWFELDPYKIVHNAQVWRLITYAFCYDRSDPFSILISLLFLYWFGVEIEQRYGSREFLAFFLAITIATGLAFVGVSLWIDSPFTALGAGGAILAVTTLYALWYPRDITQLFWILPVEARWMVFLYGIYLLHPVLVALSEVPYRGQLAHLTFLFGAVFGLVYWRRNGRLTSLLPTRRRPTSRTILAFPAKSADRTEEIDAILKKIQEVGIESLTDAERSLMIEASKRRRR